MTDIPERVSDEDLAVRSQQGDREAQDVLLERYKKTVRRQAGTCFLRGGDRDDLIQEGMIGLFLAIRDYRPERAASFATFASLVIRRKMLNAIEAGNSRKNQPLNSYISIDKETENDGLITELAGAELAGNPESSVIEKEQDGIFLEALSGSLSPFEKQVLEGMMAGRGYVEIAKELDRTPKSVDNAIQRIRAKSGRIREAGL